MKILDFVRAKGGVTGPVVDIVERLKSATNTGTGLLFLTAICDTLDSTMLSELELLELFGSRRVCMDPSRYPKHRREMMRPMMTRMKIVPTMERIAIPGALGFESSGVARRVGIVSVVVLVTSRDVLGWFWIYMLNSDQAEDCQKRSATWRGKWGKVGNSEGHVRTRCG